MAKNIAWDLLLKITRGWRKNFNISDLSVTLPGGRKIMLKGADDPETLEGVGLRAVVLDEFAKMKREAWDKSIRPALSDKGGRALFIGKPRGMNHLKEFYERGLSEESQWTDWQSWLFTTAEGGNVPLADIADGRETLPAKVYRQEYEATFETLAGRVYDAFTRRTHVVPHGELERLYKSNGRWQFRRIAIGVDWGFVDAGTAIVMGQTGDGSLVVIHEEYHTGLIVDESGWLGIFRNLRDEFRPMFFVADPSQPGYIQATRKSLGGHPVVYNADNAIHEGIRKVSIALMGGKNGRPGLIVSDRCTNTIREFETYCFEERGGQPTENPKDGDEHCLDPIRYLCQSLM
jgi:phage terminase large subunit